MNESIIYFIVAMCYTHSIERCQMLKSATNRLYEGDVSSFSEALRLHIEALDLEAKNMDSICEPGDDFPKRLHAEASEARKLLVEYTARVERVKQAEEENLIKEWLASDNEKAVYLAEVARDENWEALAV